MPFVRTYVYAGGDVVSGGSGLPWTVLRQHLHPLVAAHQQHALVAAQLSFLATEISMLHTTPLQRFSALLRCAVQAQEHLAAAEAIRPAGCGACGLAAVPGGLDAHKATQPHVARVVWLRKVSAVLWPRQPPEHAPAPSAVAAAATGGRAVSGSRPVLAASLSGSNGGGGGRGDGGATAAPPHHGDRPGACKLCGWNGRSSLQHFKVCRLEMLLCVRSSWKAQAQLSSASCLGWHCTQFSTLSATLWHFGKM